jgi:hypothetical protein
MGAQSPIGNIREIEDRANEDKDCIFFGKWLAYET